ncbi:MAG TPA: glycosyltransferase [Chthoniobacterales bacterium]|nr:glycosyltransferase [Chthoniobacterales bacterium]
MTPKVSVCIDSFNYGRFLPEAIESVLNQSFQDFEIIITDDCSTDGSLAIAQNFQRKDSRIVVDVAAANRGMVKNRNACLRRATGEYVKWLHADDFLNSTDALAKMVGALENPAVSLAASARQIVDEQSHPLTIWSCFAEKRPVAGPGVINRCLFEQRNLIGGPSAVIFRRSLAGRGFDETFFVMADLEMWFHLLEQGSFSYLDEPLCAIRQHGHQQTEKDKSSLAPALENRELIRRYLPKRYVQLRSWIRQYLEYDAVRRIVRRSKKLGHGAEQVEAAVAEFGGWRKYRTQTLTNRYREALLKVRRLYERHLRQPAPAQKHSFPLGINMAGFVQSVYGIGESSRGMWRAVQATGLPCALINIRSQVHSNTDVSVGRFAGENPYSVNLMTFSFDYSRRFYRDMGPGFFAGRYNIGLWYWEQEQFPLRWHSSFDYYDEIWVPTEFTRQAIAAVSPIPVRKITYPFDVETHRGTADRVRFGLPSAAYVFLFTFDFFSTVPRKNPGAIIAAFRTAFRPDDNAVLVLKSINAERNRTERESLGQAAGDAKVVFMDDHISREEMNSLFASADCYVSLHRSEGLGLGMAHAMSSGKPVIATNYSGNLEFMNTGNSLLVNFVMTELQMDAGPYERGTRWAEPDVDEAAHFMRWIYEHRTEGEGLGAQAAADIRRTLDPDRTAAEISQRIHELADTNRTPQALKPG